MRRQCALALVAGLTVPAVAFADDIHVPGDFATIQAAITASLDGDEIIVAPGTYPGAIDLLGRAITLRSSGGPLVTTIDASVDDTSVVTCETFEGADTVIEGFTLTGGTGTMLGAVRGGGAMLNDLADPTVKNCIFEGNSARNGAGMYNRVANPTVLNCVFQNNVGTVLGKGGAVYNDTSNPLFTNCTMTRNETTDGGAFYNDTSVPRLINCVIWQNTPESFLSTGEIPPIATFSNIDIPGANPYTGEGNIKADPLFTDPESGDLSLLSVSPCIDRGDSTAVAAVVFEDIATLPRGVDVPTVPDRGVAVFALNVDMGAYEFQVDAPPSDCPADIDGTGDVGFTDLLSVLSFWGPCP